LLKTLTCVEIFLPLRRPDGSRVGRGYFRALGQELTELYGGVTAYSRAPAKGRWVDAGGAHDHDDIVIYEVMVETLDAEWWGRLRKRLEADLNQQEILLRAYQVTRL